MSRALIVVDIQNDFCEGGSLPVDGGVACASMVSDLIAREGERWGLIVASRDYHSPTGDNQGHFGNPPDFVDTWPPHCVVGSKGADYHQNLILPGRVVEVRKGIDEPAYSAFQGRVHGDADREMMILDELLCYHDIRSIDVVGIALDYCVKQTAIDAVRCGYTTTVLSYYTASVVPVNDHTTFCDLINNGVTVAGNRKALP
jgi:nicotinamidase/pyrazinamidase